MSHQPIDCLPVRSAARRYQDLLEQRILLALRITDLLCHSRSSRVADAYCVELLARMDSLDARLWRWRRYPADYLIVVGPAEDQRWHVPPQPPVDHAVVPCVLCADPLVAAGFVPVVVL